MKLYIVIFFALISTLPAQKSYDKTIKKYFFVEFIPSLKKSDQKIQKLHLSYIAELAEKNKLVLAGPFKKGGGIFILNVETKAEAIQIIENDESVRKKINSYRILEWYTEKGLFTLE